MSDVAMNIVLPMLLVVAAAATTSNS